MCNGWKWPSIGAGLSAFPARCENGRATTSKEDKMSIARVTEISANSTKSFEDAVQEGIRRASKSLRNVRSAWVKEQQVRVTDGEITEYQVNLMVTFVLDD